jgi:alkanesulfonate monooxygenase SsuD/methylene tetrahydromethanopterin reductase-like flavin-dependent oxidoreductase (luciferase family)
MRFGAHLPQIDFDGTGHDVAGLGPYVEAARDLGYSAITANDHLVFQRPWLDGLVALASVLDRAGELTVATTVALPVVRGPVVLARTAAALNLLSGGRLVLGVAPGSSARDYAAVGVPFEERWSRFDAALTVLRAELEGESIPIWVGSWGSAAGLRRVARLGDGWLASAYNTTPERLAAGRTNLDAALLSAGRDPAGFPLALATMWTFVTDDRAEAETRLGALASMLDRDPVVLGRQVLIGTAEHCAGVLGAYAQVGVETVFIWPVGDPISQLHTFARQVVPRLGAQGLGQ